MNRYSAFLGLVISALMSGPLCGAEKAESNASVFAYLYLNTCMKNINDLNAFRGQLMASKVPKLPVENAVHFLQGNKGDAWPVPHEGQDGNFVLALYSEKNFCAVYGRRANAADVERLFILMVSTAPPPLISEMKSDTSSDTEPNGKTHTISYTWSLPQARRKMLFTLTTAPSQTAQLQAMASAAMISE